jgi:hypothetical protein
MAIPVNSFNNIKTIAVSHFSSGRERKRAMLVLGAPGGGKTALGWAIAYALGCREEEIRLRRPSLNTPVDYTGMPGVANDMTVWFPPDFLKELSTGQIKFLILDEVPDAYASVQNILCGLIYDYDVNGLRIHPDLCIFATGNQVKHRSGANQLVSKLPNRASVHELGQSMDFVDWGTRAGLDMDMLSFINWKGQNALYGESGFDPSEMINATPRQWEEVSYIDPTLPAHLFLSQVASFVPEGLAIEYVAFRKTVRELPNIQTIYDDPDNAQIADKIDVGYAITSRIILDTDNPGKFQKLMRYVCRLRPEIQAHYVNTVVKRVPGVKETPQYNTWCFNNRKVLGGS